MRNITLVQADFGAVTFNKKTVMISGGFDPLHVGHVQLIQAAARHGLPFHTSEFNQVIVALNSDDWLRCKKGYVFMPWTERANIMISLKHVRVVTPIDDSDGTAIDAIRRNHPDYFANGGDRTKKNVPEQPICNELGVEMLWGMGGEDKPQSSSWLVNKAMEQLRESDHGN